MINSGTLSELEHFGNPKYEKLLKSPIILWGEKNIQLKCAGVSWLLRFTSHFYILEKFHGQSQSVFTNYEKTEQDWNI